VLRHRVTVLHAMPPRRTRNSDRPRASDRTMVATELNRLPSFKSRRTLSPLENEPKETEEQSREEPLEQSRDIPAGSGLDIETKNISATARGRCFFVDIPFYRTTYLRMRRYSRVVVNATRTLERRPPHATRAHLVRYSPLCGRSCAYRLVPSMASATRLSLPLSE
jgi:hypothetical protein